MNGITSRPYRLYQDHMAVYQFMLEIYERDWRNGVPAPFLEYALHSSWMDKKYAYLNRLWFEDGKIVAMVFNESPVTDVYFSLRPGYEALADEMLAYAEEHMPNFDDKRQLVLFHNQTALRDAAARRGYRQHNQYWDHQYDFGKPLDWSLPEGYRFVPQDEMDVAKILLCCWKGFNHEAEEGPWNGDLSDGLMLLTAPHQTSEHAVCIQDETGEYVCYAGMWWTPANHLAYMEPLCTVPAHRRKGLAAAALSEMYRRTKALGATHMTGGGDPFYVRLGFQPVVQWTFWKK